ncbi:kinesin-like protein Klp61F [Phlebotomus argentipes]|uniref:kinesin-like protein Klp61F n=1 Tax=Phlebotomus argentipes TaxID=94469 RepID=UPI002892F5A0|nr:kinesin-like protein Klp61F [Phlebotomus argentipes]
MDISGPSTSAQSRGNQNIQVFLRIRPLSARERTQKSQEVVDATSSREVHVRQGPEAKSTKKFTFDRVFGIDSEQNTVYRSVVAPYIGEVLSGYNCTVFAYGQTGTGKTYTMVGGQSPALRMSWEDNNPLGIIPRAVVHLFDELRMMDVEYTMRVSYLELYNEELCDLLGTEDKLRIYDDSTRKGCVIVQGLKEIPVHSKDDVYKLLAKGQERRKTASTLMNAQSSRSHTVFSIVVHIKENGLGREDMLKTGRLNLVDLAGSENATKAGNEKGIRTREAVNINQSLLTLGRVITALVERQPHVPYRESKLTRLLQESLGGRTKTSIIATISPGHKDLEETLNTLDYAHRAKNIQNRPEINQRLTKNSVLKEYTEEIDRLQRELDAAREKNGIFLPPDSYNEMSSRLDSQSKELTEKTFQIQAMKVEMEKKDQLFSEIERSLQQRTVELRVTSESLNRTNLVLRDTKQTLKLTERRYEESTHLVSAHQDTERMLSGQAKDLLEVANEASADTHALHEAIKRRKVVDGDIHRTMEDFADTFHGQANATKERVMQFKENILAQVSDVRGEIEGNFTHHTASASNMRNILMALGNLQKNSLENFMELYMNFASTFSKTSNATSAAFEEHMKGVVSKQKRIHEEIQMQVNELGCYEKSLRDVHKSMLESEKRFCSASRESVQKHTEINQEFLEKLKKHVAVILVERNDEIRMRIQQNDEKLKSILAENQAIVHLLDDNEASKVAIQAEIDQNHAHISDYRANVVESVQTMDVEREKIEPQLERFSKQHLEIQEKLREKNDGSFSAVRDDVMQILEEVQLQSARTRVNLDAQCEESVKIFQAQVKVALNTVDGEYEKLMASQTAVNAIISDTAQSAEEMNTFVNSTVEKWQEDVENLKTSDLKTYSSTGETPGRKDFTYPRNLAATSPHERILKRFRTFRDNASQSSSEIYGQGSFEAEAGRSPVASTPIQADEQRCLRELTSNVSQLLTIPLKNDPNGSISSIVEISDDDQENVERPRT